MAAVGLFVVEWEKSSVNKYEINASMVVAVSSGMRFWKARKLHMNLESKILKQDVGV